MLCSQHPGRLAAINTIKVFTAGQVQIKQLYMFRSKGLGLLQALGCSSWERRLSSPAIPQPAALSHYMQVNVLCVQLQFLLHNETQSWL